MIFYAGEALAWSAAGFVLGFLFCWVLKISMADPEEKLPMNSRSRRLEIVRTVLGIFILLLVVVSSIRYYRVTDCQTQYNSEIARVLAETSDARGKETLAEANKARAQAAWLRELIGLRGQNPQQGLAATGEYLRTLDAHVAALEELERVRVLHPIPQPPDCGRFP